MNNVSLYTDDNTARTNITSCYERARYISTLNVDNVLELCVGPSLKELETAYQNYSITCFGNDIDNRWVKYHPTGMWVIGDCLTIDYSLFDFVVFAPPLSKGCSGKREDSLMIDEVFPRYCDFLGVIGSKKCCMVLPARSLGTRMDRIQLYKLLSKCPQYSIIERTDGKIRKYVEIYLNCNNK